MKIMNETNFVNVSQINEYIKTILSADENLTGLFIRGEISNFTHHLKSGHFYFTLKDEKTSIKAVMFKGSARFVKFRPENGMKVVVFGSIRVFERDGIYQLYCEDMQPDGLGAPGHSSGIHTRFLLKNVVPQHIQAGAVRYERNDMSPHSVHFLRRHYPDQV